MHAKVANASQKLDPDRPPADAFFLTSEILRVVSEPPAGGGEGPARNFLKAWGDATALAEDKTIQADILTYDSLNELFYAYGEDGREVTIAQQDGPGQPASVLPGRAVQYNRKTGEKQVIDPRSVQFLDAKTGIGPPPSGPPAPRPSPPGVLGPSTRPPPGTTWSAEELQRPMRPASRERARLHRSSSSRPASPPDNAARRLGPGDARGGPAEGTVYLIAADDRPHLEPISQGVPNVRVSTLFWVRIRRRPPTLELNV